MCGSCQRYQLPCIYDRQIAKHAPQEKEIPTKPVEDSAAHISITDARGEYPETKKRRLLELKLLHHYITKTSPTFNLSAQGSDKQSQPGLWNSDLPNLAFDNDALLNMMLAIAALHTAKCNTHDLDALHGYQQYLDLAVKEHSNDVVHLNKMNADSTCLTSSLIRVAAFANLQERPLDPYTPPVQWLEMTRGAGNIFKEAWQFIGDNESSLAFQAINGTPVLKSPEALFEECNRQDLLHLLHNNRDDHAPEFWNADIEEAYASTLSYLGSVQSLIGGGEEPPTVCRVLMLFPYTVKQGFIDLVKEQRPRALVILAHYFGLLARFKYNWFIGNTGPREIRAIQTALTEEWQDLMAWPLQILAET